MGRLGYKRSAPKREAPKRTLLKIRARPLVRMPKSVFFTKIRSACRDGVIPSDIEISTLNWDHARGRTYKAGQVLSGRDRDELMNCYQMLTGMSKQDVRFERPE